MTNEQELIMIRSCRVYIVMYWATKNKYYRDEALKIYAELVDIYSGLKKVA